MKFFLLVALLAFVAVGTFAAVDDNKMRDMGEDMPMEELDGDVPVAEARGGGGWGWGRGNGWGRGWGRGVYGGRGYRGYF